LRQPHLRQRSFETCSVGVRGFSVWTILSKPFRSDRFGLAVSVTWFFGLGRFGLETFRSDNKILQKSYMFTF